MLGAISSTTPSRFIEDNWGLPRLGGEAMDQWAGSLAGMFDFNMPARTDVLILDPATGMPSGGPVTFTRF